MPDVDEKDEDLTDFKISFRLDLNFKTATFLPKTVKEKWIVPCNIDWRDDQLRQGPNKCSPTIPDLNRQIRLVIYRKRKSAGKGVRIVDDRVTKKSDKAPSTVKNAFPTSDIVELRRLADEYKVIEFFRDTLSGFLRFN